MDLRDIELAQERLHEELKKCVQVLPVEERLAGLTPEQLVARLTPEQLVARLTPEQRLAGLTEEQLIAALPPELARKLRDEA